MWLTDEDKYIRQSLRTKDKAKTIADAFYENIKYMKRRGKKYYSISIKQAVDMYIEDKARYVGIVNANGIVEGSRSTQEISSCSVSGIRSVCRSSTAPGSRAHALRVSLQRTEESYIARTTAKIAVNTAPAILWK